MRYLLLFFLILFPAAAQDVFESEGQKFRLEHVLKTSDVIWGFDFVSADKIIFTERGGRMSFFDFKSKKTTELSGIPKVFSQSQGGLLDISVAPGQKGPAKRIYFTYSIPRGSEASTALGSALFETNKLTEVRTIFEAAAFSTKGQHFGSRIVWQDDKTLFMTVGERNEREKAQQLGNHHGKILRLTTDGKAAPGNPFAKTPGALPEIWSYGHRNPQGLVIDKNRNLLDGEFGPRGGDEINLVRPGKNYGWPVITYGKEYYGPSIGEGTAKAGMEQPLVYWVPVISPSGMDFYYGKLFPKWQGNLFIGALSATHLRRVVFDKDYKVTKQEVLLASKGWRIRHVRSGPEGYIYLSTDSGILARLVPVK